MKHTLIALAVLTIVGCPLMSRADDATPGEIELRLRLHEGDKYTITTTTEKKEGFWVHDIESTNTMTIGMWLTMEVLTVNEDGTATVKLTFDRITCAGQSPMGSFKYDSQDADQEVEFPLSIYQAVIGKSFGAKLSPTGKVLKVLDTMPLHLAITSALPTKRRIELSSPGGMEALRLMQTGALKELAASPFFICPDEPVAVGGTWTEEGKLSGDPPATCDVTYKLASRQDGVATIEVEGTAKHDPNANLGGGVFVTNVEGELKGTRKGTVRLDEASGVIIESTITTSLGGEMKRGAIITTDPGGDHKDDEHEEMSVPQTTDTTVTVKCKKQT